MKARGAGVLAPARDTLRVGRANGSRARLAVGTTRGDRLGDALVPATSEARVTLEVAGGLAPANGHALGDRVRGDRTGVAAVATRRHVEVRDTGGAALVKARSADEAAVIAVAGRRGVRHRRTGRAARAAGQRVEVRDALVATAVVAGGAGEVADPARARRDGVGAAAAAQTRWAACGDGVDRHAAASTRERACRADAHVPHRVADLTVAAVGVRLAAELAPAVRRVAEVTRRARRRRAHRRQVLARVVVTILARRARPPAHAAVAEVGARVAA